MTDIEWELDPLTAYWAGRVSLPRELPATAQWPGGRIWAETWRPLIGGGTFPAHCDDSDAGYLSSRPENILACLREERLLEALALIVAWGGMSRAKARVYERGLEEVRSVLEESKRLLREQRDVRAAWASLSRLGWSPVMRSKWLHFAARACGYERTPPVPIDGAVIVNRVWPWFRGTAAMLAASKDKMPGAWVDDSASWAGYNRYMTAVTLWAAPSGLTTTEIENRLYALFSQW